MSDKLFFCWRRQRTALLAPSVSLACVSHAGHLLLTDCLLSPHIERTKYNLLTVAIKCISVDIRTDRVFYAWNQIEDSFHRGGYVFVCVRPFICLLAGLRENGSADFHKIGGKAAYGWREKRHRFVADRICVFDDHSKSCHNGNKIAAITMLADKFKSPPTNPYLTGICHSSYECLI